MKEKILTKTEYKDYLIKIQEDKNTELEKKIRRYDNFFYISLLVIFPLALFGLIHLIEVIDIKFFMIMLVVIVVGLGVIALFGFLVQKIQNR